MKAPVLWVPELCDLVRVSTVMDGGCVSSLRFHHTTTRTPKQPVQEVSLQESTAMILFDRAERQVSGGAGFFVSPWAATDSTPREE